MVKVANRIAKEHGHKAIVTGDNLSQVASQTLENLSVLDNASELPIFRPLLTYDKREIITSLSKSAHMSCQFSLTKIAAR